MSAGEFRLEVHEALTSTSELVARRAEAGEPAGLALLALRQTAGRGTRGRAWESPPGNLYLTVLLRPGGPLREAPQWSLLAGVALADALAPLLPDPSALSLKWPNDALLRGRKAAGILTQSGADPAGRLAWLSFGFGVNLTAAPELPGRATACLADEGVATPAPEAFAALLLESLGAWCALQRAQGFAPVREAWIARGPAPGTEIAVAGTHGVLGRGRFAGLAEDGSLLLSEGGTLHALAAGEVMS